MRYAYRQLLCVGVFLGVFSAGACKADDQDGKEFLAQTLSQQRNSIASYPPEKQVDFYLRAMIEQHPPDLAHADAVARGGAKLVPVLKSRLVKDKRDIAKVHLVDVFLRMQELGYYSVATDSETMAFLTRQVESMSDSRWAEIAIEMVSQIRIQSPN